MSDYKYTLGEQVKFDIAANGDEERKSVGVGVGVVTRVLAGGFVVVRPLSVIRAGYTITNVRPAKEDHE